MISLLCAPCARSTWPGDGMDGNHTMASACQHAAQRARGILSQRTYSRTGQHDDPADRKAPLKTTDASIDLHQLPHIAIDAIASGLAATAMVIEMMALRVQGDLAGHGQAQGQTKE